MVKKLFDIYYEMFRTQSFAFLNKKRRVNSSEVYDIICDVAKENKEDIGNKNGVIVYFSAKEYERFFRRDKNYEVKE